MERRSTGKPRSPETAGQQAPADHQNIETSLRHPYSSVLTSISVSHRIWQLRQCSLPSMETRHSKQMPIPHKGPRASPVTDLRQACPAITTATATVVLEGTEMDLPFTLNVTWLSMGKLVRAGCAANTAAHYRDVISCLSHAP